MKSSTVPPRSGKRRFHNVWFFYKASSSSSFLALRSWIIKSSTVPPRSKKRRFPRERSSSSGFKDVETPSTGMISVRMLSQEKEHLVTNLSSEGSKNADPDDSNSKLFFGEDEWTDTYYDNIPLTNTLLESWTRFDHLDIPTWIEVNFPWLPVGPRISTNSTPASTSVNIEPNKTHPIPNPISPHSSKRRLRFSKRQEPARPVTYIKNKRKYHASNVYTSRDDQVKSSGGVQLNLGMPKEVHGLRNDVMPDWKDFLPPDIVKPSGFMNRCGKVPETLDFAGNQKGKPSGGPEVVDEVSRDSELFKNFDTVADCSDNYFANYNLPDQEKPSKNWPKRIQEEWKILEKDLPDTIFVRIYKSRIDLLRAVIVGAEGTPYHNDLFCFDFLFTGSYPYCPPKVYLHSNGLPLHPMLYKGGRVCLSLLDNWSSSSSTMLQVLVSIQGLLLNAKPYFYHHEHVGTGGTEMAEIGSLRYNETTFIYNIRHMVLTLRRPPKHFEALVVEYFRKHARDILESCKSYMYGAQVGCLIRGGGGQDLRECDKSCSESFRRKLGSYLRSLIKMFVRIWAEDCKEFLYLDPNNLPPIDAHPRPPVSNVKKTNEGGDL